MSFWKIVLLKRSFKWVLFISDMLRIWRTSYVLLPSCISCWTIAAKREVHIAALIYFAYEVMSILFKKVIVSILIRSCQRCFWNILAHSYVITLGVMSIKSNYQISKIFTIGKLTKHQSKPVDSNKWNSLCSDSFSICWLCVETNLRSEMRLIEQIHISHYSL